MPKSIASLWPLQVTSHSNMGAFASQPMVYVQPCPLKFMFSLGFLGRKNFATFSSCSFSYELETQSSRVSSSSATESSQESSTIVCVNWFLHFRFHLNEASNSGHWQRSREYWAFEQVPYCHVVYRPPLSTDGGESMPKAFLSLCLIGHWINRDAVLAN